MFFLLVCLFVCLFVCLYQGGLLQKVLGRMNQLTMPSGFLQSIPTSRPDLILRSECYSVAV